MIKASVAFALVLASVLPDSFLSFSNVTLVSEDLSVTVYLPAGVSDDDNTFYKSSRFEHGSMIGSIQRKTREVVISKEPDEAGAFQKEEREYTRELYGTELWRTPHNPYWPESGVGLASEFGVGDDGANCDLRCGCNGVDDVTNGVLGFKEAEIGQSFLKIGVGELIKGTCPICDFTGIYRFNSPYQFAKAPEWKMHRPSDNIVVLEHEARLNQYGYKLAKTIVLEDDVLSVTSTLTNLGTDAFQTAWYSHHFFNCDAHPIGPGYSLQMDLKETKSQLFEEPGLSGWTVPLRNYAQVKQRDDFVDIYFKRFVEDGARIKAEFYKDEQSKGGFTLSGCGVSIREEIPEIQQDPAATPSMYAFNVYIEQSTLSPEPQILIHLERGASATWTQRLVFADEVAFEQEAHQSAIEGFSLTSIGASIMPSHSVNAANAIGGMTIVAAAAALAAMFAQRRWWSRRSSYTRIEN